MTEKVNGTDPYIMREKVNGTDPYIMTEKVNGTDPYIMTEKVNGTDANSNKTNPHTKLQTEGDVKIFTITDLGHSKRIDVDHSKEFDVNHSKAIDVEHAKENPIKFTKWQMRKNVFVLCIGFTSLFTAFMATGNLQTSLNKEDGVGAWSMFTIYIGVIVGCMLLPDFVISRLGCKWTIPLCMTGYVLFIAANFYAIKALMIPSSALLGLGASCMWSATSVYLTQMGVWYAVISGQQKNDVITLFFGVFFGLFNTGNIWGNLISSLIFTSSHDHDCLDSGLCYPNLSASIASYKNNSILSVDSNFEQSSPKCGVAFCPSDAVASSNTDNFEQPMSKVYLVVGLYVACGVLGVLIISVFLDDIVLDKKTEKKRLSLHLLVSTFRHLLTSKRQILLVPITIYDGMAKAFITADYTKAFVTCSLGIWNVGYVMICYGAVNSICSFCFGRIIKHTGHRVLFVIGFLVHGGALITMLLWQPNSSFFAVFFVVAGLWGAGDAVFTSQIFALYGRIFTGKTEPAFANFKLWESVGYVILYSYNEYLCMTVKLYILIGALVVGMASFAVTEIVSRTKQRENVVHIVTVEMQVNHSTKKG